MKSTILSSIYDAFEWIDRQLGTIEKFNYETAPYCGHHHCGHKGKFTHSHYHEGMGGKDVGNDWLRIMWTNEDDRWNIFSNKWTEYKTVAQSFKIKIVGAWGEKNIAISYRRSEFKRTKTIFISYYKRYTGDDDGRKRTLIIN